MPLSRSGEYKWNPRETPEIKLDKPQSVPQLQTRLSRSGISWFLIVVVVKLEALDWVWNLLIPERENKIETGDLQRSDQLQASTMASSYPSLRVVRSFFTSAILVLGVAAVVINAQLSTSFYDATCPLAASIIQRKVDEFVEADRGLAAALMRLHFHDCFVRGCDGSVLLNSTDTVLAEKEALLNQGSLRGFEQIDEIKMELECACPGVVSCADILALVARDATVKVGGLSWPVFLGRIDGAGSFADEVNGSLPERRDNFTKLVETFAKVGLDAKDMIILSGGHSIGQVRCGAFFERLYNFEGENATDPSIDPEFADSLKSQCPQTQPFAFMALDGTNGTFDSTYYLDLLTNKGLLESDVALLTDPLGVEYAIKAVQDPDTFLFEFGVAMIKMGSVPSADPYGWRKHCAYTEPRNY